MNSLG